MMNQDTRRLQKVDADVRDEYLIFCPKEPRFPLLLITRTDILQMVYLALMKFNDMQYAFVVVEYTDGMVLTRKHHN